MEPTVESNQVEEFETRPDFPPPPPRCLWELKLTPKIMAPTVQSEQLGNPALKSRSQFPG